MSVHVRQHLTKVAEAAKRKYRMAQLATEIVDMMELLLKRNIQTVVEIGTRRGGSLMCWSSVASEDATIVGIDIGGNEGKMNTRIEEWLLPTQSGRFFRGDSKSSVLQSGVVSYLEDTIDFLFIDGDHTLEGVSRDFDAWFPFVQEGGLIAFHDITPKPSKPEYEVHKFWKNLSKSIDLSRLWEFTTEGASGYGIGVIEK